MADANDVPQIRFKGFTDPWEQRKLGDCFEFLKNNTLSRADLNGDNGTTRNVHYGDILIKFGDCLDGERNDLPFIADDTVLPKFAGSILREGDVIFADTAEDEAAGKCVELRKLPKEPTISGLHTIPARPRFPFGTGYLGHYLNSDAYHRQLLPLMQGIKVISVSKAALQDTQVRFPGLSEQTAIGSALSEIDSLITLHQRKCDKLSVVKKALLEKMFPKEGEVVPEIRFKGFTDPWEQRKLGELCEVNPTTVLPGSFEYVDLESVVGTDMVSHRREEKLTAPSRAQRLASFGDIFYQTVRPYQKNNYFYELPDKDYVFSTGYAQLRPLCDGRFLFSSLQREQFVSCVLEHCTGTSYPAINTNDLAALPLAVPSDIEEQRLVGSILKPIDALITLHQRELETLKNVKKALLEKMFV